MQRHGSRYPLTTELSPYITGLVAKLANASSALSSAQAARSLPSELLFLTKGYTTSLGTNDLTAPGRAQLFDAGVKYVSVPHSLSLFLSFSLSFFLSHFCFCFCFVFHSAQDRYSGMLTNGYKLFTCN